MRIASLTGTSSLVVDHLFREQRQHKNSLDMGIAVVYLKYNDPEQTLNTILGSLLQQLAQSQQALPTSLRHLYEGYSDPNNPPTLEDISKATQTIIGAYEEVFFVIDALDECSDEIRWGLMDKLRDFGSTIHLLVTSRFQHSIDEELEDFARLEIKANRTDIELFIDQQIQKNRSLRRVIENKPSLREDMKRGVVQNC